MQIISKAKNGAVSFNDDELKKFLLKNEGKEILVSFDVFGEKKSREQLAFFYAGVIGSLVDLGWTKREAEIYLKQHCGECEQVPDPMTGEIRLILPSIADMNMKELSVFIDACIKHLGEQGVDVPQPESYWKSKRVK